MRDVKRMAFGKTSKGLSRLQGQAIDAQLRVESALHIPLDNVDKYLGGKRNRTRQQMAAHHVARGACAGDVQVQIGLAVLLAKVAYQRVYLVVLGVRIGDVLLGFGIKNPHRKAIGGADARHRPKRDTLVLRYRQQTRRYVVAFVQSHQ